MHIGDTQTRWRNLPNERDWKVTPVTERLLKHWRKKDVEGIRPFFCQVEAVETVIWLTEVAKSDPRLKKYWQRMETANKDANPELLRLAMKMATGAGKTTVMAMLIACGSARRPIACRSSALTKFREGFSHK